jgi:hypothetical protein
MGASACRRRLFRPTPIRPSALPENEPHERHRLRSL